MHKFITRKYISEKIDSLLSQKISIRNFGDEMFCYLSDDNYEYEEGYESLIEEVLSEFMDMHDFKKKNAGYEPYIPTKEKLLELKEKLFE